MKEIKQYSLEEKLKEIGAGLDEVADTAISMYIYDPAIGHASKVRLLVKKEIRKALNDINVRCLVMAGLYIEQAASKGLIPGMPVNKYKLDPVDLIADEILGQSIAAYIAGTRALFEFERLDKKKPGVLKKLPPIMDDVVAGLISGVMVKVCSR